MNTNLILVEGLPGSGKSTTAAMIADKVRARGERVVCFDEGEPGNPLDDFDYDFPDFQAERLKILETWRDFAGGADRSMVYVFNCVLLQNPMTETMMRFGMTELESRAYIAEIVEIIKPLNPVVIYIDLPDVRGTIDAVLDERGSGWLDAVVEYHTSQGYGKQKRLTGCEGYIKCLEARKARELNILRTLDLEYRIIGRTISCDSASR